MGIKSENELPTRTTIVGFGNLSDVVLLILWNWYDELIQVQFTKLNNTAIGQICFRKHE